MVFFCRNTTMSTTNAIVYIFVVTISSHHPHLFHICFFHHNLRFRYCLCIYCIFDFFSQPHTSAVYASISITRYCNSIIGLPKSSADHYSPIAHNFRITTFAVVMSLISPQFSPFPSSTCCKYSNVFTSCILFLTAVSRFHTFFHHF